MKQVKSFNLSFYIISVTVLFCIVLMHQIPFSFFSSSILDAEFENLLHCYGFAGVAFCALYFCKKSYHLTFNKHTLSFYIIIFIFIIVAGALSELIQILFARDADITDLFRDATGGFSAILLFLSFDKTTLLWGKKEKLLIRFTSIAILFLSTIPFLKTVQDFRMRNSSVPQLYTFEQSWEKQLIQTNGSTFEIIPTPKIWTTNLSKKVAKVSFEKGEYPTLLFNGFFPDWTGFKSFNFDIFSEAKDTVSLALRINDRFHNNEYYDRFNTSLRIAPGKNTFSIPINKIQVSPHTRLMNLKQISMICFFVSNKNVPMTIFIDNLMLAAN